MSSPEATFAEIPTSPSAETASERPAEAGPAAGARVHTLTRVLRVLGAAVVAASATTFLFQHWERGNDLTRYFVLLAQSGVLTAVGFFCAVRMKESKSARTFMALSAGMVPALACILGGLVYSTLSWDGGAVPVAEYASWVAPSGPAALATAGLTLLVAAPVAFLSFLSLARPQARALTGVFLAANGALLIPTRAPDAMAAVLAAVVAGLAACEVLRFRHDSAMRTFEGAVARAMLAAPALLLVARSTLHYEVSLFMGSVLSLAGAAALFVAGRTAHARPWGALLERLAVLPLGVAWLMLAFGMRGSFALPEAAVLPLAGLPFSASLVGLSLYVQRDGRAHQQLAVVVSLVLMAVNLFVAPGVLSAFLALVTGIVAVGYGLFFDRRGVLGLGVLTAAAALVSHVGHAIELYAHLHWSSLSVLGIAVILGASVIERHHRSIAEQVARLRERARAQDC